MIGNEFQSQIEDFLKRYELTPTTFGLWAANDPRFVFDVRKGRSCSLSTASKIVKFMMEYAAKQEAKQHAKNNQK
jgi:predicted transcriptional regulator